MDRMDPLLAALSGDPTELPPTQSIANAAIIAVFAYLVPLLTMEINYFRLAVYKSWRRGGGGGERSRSAANAAAAHDKDVVVAHDEEEVVAPPDLQAIASGEPFETTGGASTNPSKPLEVDDDDDDNGSSSSSSSSSAVGHLLHDVAAALHHETTASDGNHNKNTQQQQQQHSNSNNNNNNNNNDPNLQLAYKIIRTSSTYAILSSLLLYSLTALAIGMATRDLDPKVVAIIVGSSQFVTSVIIFIVSAKVPQWIGVYHQGAIRLVKCSSNYSQKFERINLYHHDQNTKDDNENEESASLRQLRQNVRWGVWFHFSKFYIILMPFYCGVQEATIPLSIVTGAVFGFILMWAVFVVHEKYIHHRNIVSFTTIILLSIISALTLVRGMAWIQVVWQLNILQDEDLLLVISFFTWLGLLVLVHALFLWHTIRTEEGKGGNKDAGNTNNESNGNNNHNNTNSMGYESGHGSKAGGAGKNPKAMRRNSSYSSFVFDPRTHFVDGKCQFSEHPDLEDDLSSNNSTDALLSDASSPAAAVVVIPDGGGDLEGQEDDVGLFIETPVVPDDTTGDGFAMEFDKPDEIANNVAHPKGDDDYDDDDAEDLATGNKSNNRRCCCCKASWCEVFICFSPEYQQSSCLWKFLILFKIFIIAMSYLLCLYFVIVCIGATYQISTVKAALPGVHEALYNHMNEGPVCAFDNQGPDSNITTFKDKEAAHDAGFLVVHCGACGACSNWENLIVEWTTRNNMAALANECAKDSLFGGGNDATTACLMKPEIGFGHDCAVCWMEDIMCTKDHCAFIFLQSQITNNVGNFAVGEDEITSASCEEAHCEVGQFVPCSGATRRRMNITSSISRPGDQQCEIVDVKSWEDLFFGSGYA